jgi:hypothetical protein
LGYSDFATKGDHGSYCYDGACADVGVWPPPADGLPIVETQGQSLIFSVDKGEFDQWTVEYGPDMGALTLLANGGDHSDPDMATQTLGPALSFVEFDGPPRGDWVVTVLVYLAGGGSASYAWHVIVE